MTEIIHAMGHSFTAVGEACTHSGYKKETHERVSSPLTAPQASGLLLDQLSLISFGHGLRPAIYTQTIEDIPEFPGKGGLTYR